MNTIRRIEPADRGAVETILAEHWGESRIVSRGKVLDAAALPGFVAYSGRTITGLLTYHSNGTDYEIVSLNALDRTQGIGTSLLSQLEAQAKADNCRRVWLVTTNDNLNALRFYQRRGFELVAVHRRALDNSRVLKPGIPLVGEHGIPLRDEIELEKLL
jgi:DNA-3-methyladenine glycosylase I